MRRAEYVLTESVERDQQQNLQRVGHPVGELDDGLVEPEQHARQTTENSGGAQDRKGRQHAAQSQGQGNLVRCDALLELFEQDTDNVALPEASFFASRVGRCRFFVSGCSHRRRSSSASTFASAGNRASWIST